MAKSSKTSTTNQQTPLHFKSHQSKNRIKYIPYTLARRIHTIMDKSLKKLALKNYTQPYTREDTQQHQHKGFELAEKMPQRELRNPKNTTTRNL